MTTAADGLKQLELRALRVARTRNGVIVLGVVAMLGVTYCAGHSVGESSVRSATVDSVRHVLADSSHAIEAREKARVLLIAKAETVFVATHAAHAKAAARIAIVDDSTVRIDSGPPVHEISASLVIPEIRTCNQALAADTVLIHVDAAQLADVTKDRDTWKARATLDEANTPHPSRFGFRSGLIAGATVVVAVLHFVR